MNKLKRVSLIRFKKHGHSRGVTPKFASCMVEQEKLRIEFCYIPILARASYKEFPYQIDKKNETNEDSCVKKSSPI